MSYILEALKKSQKERELGQVPTLVAAPASNPRRVSRSAPWRLVAAGLAALAVAITLYAALNGSGDQAGAQPVLSQDEPEASGSSRQTQDAGAGRQGSMAAAGQPVGASEVPGEALAAGAAPPPPAAGSSPQLLSSAGGDNGSVPPSTLGQAEPPAERPTRLSQNAITGDVPAGRGRRSPRPAPLPDLAEIADEQEAEIVSSPDQEGVMDEPASDDWMEMDEEIGPAGPDEPEPPVPAAEARPSRTKPPRATLPEPESPPIPDDLRRDVAAFKDQIRRERTGAPPRPVQSTPEDPKKLRLPLEVEARLPAFFLTAHIYDTAEAKRFVVINALKYTQGETTREGLKVEDILPDGTVLSFEGQRFYRRR
jgi:general secretion pathway protein B